MAEVTPLGRIRAEGKNLDYEQMALDAVVRSWTLDDRECQALALADAQVFATLQLARVTKVQQNVSWKP